MHITQKKKIDQAEALAQALKNAERALDSLSSLCSALGLEFDKDPAHLPIFIAMAEKKLEQLTSEAGRELLEERLNAPKELVAEVPRPPKNKKLDPSYPAVEQMGPTY